MTQHHAELVNVIQGFKMRRRQGTTQGFIAKNKYTRHLALRHWGTHLILHPQQTGVRGVEILVGLVGSSQPLPASSGTLEI